MLKGRSITGRMFSSQLTAMRKFIYSVAKDSPLVNDVEVIWAE
jgi:hypothetical protein